MSTEIIVYGLLIIATILFCIKIGIQIYSIPIKWKVNNKEVAIKMLIEDIKRAKKRILIYGGSGETYNTNGILEALRQKETPIKMVFQDKNFENTRLWELAKEKRNLSLGFIDGDTFQGHFRVIDHDYVYIEKKHARGSDKRPYKRFKNARFLPAKYAQQFSTIASSATII